MRGTEKKREKLKASRHFIDEPKRSLSYSAPGAYILPQPRKITKKKTKTKSYYKGQNGKKTKRGQKKSKIKNHHEQC